MFDLDTWQEIWHSIQKNKLRTFLTVFGVFWGILMLIILLGSGRGLENSVQGNMDGFATNSVYIWASRTTMPYKGLPAGRGFTLTNEDTRALRSGLTNLEYLAPRNQLGGWRQGNNVKRGANTGAFSIMGDYPDFMHIQRMNITAGRFINDIDISGTRKVAIIGKQPTEILFGTDDNPVGQYIQINGVYFQVVGVFTSKRGGHEAERDNETIFIPFTTFQKAFSFYNWVSWYAMTSKKGTKASELETDARLILANMHKVDPKDESAFGSFNVEEEFVKVNGLFTGISILLWFVGIGTLMAGIIGVSNIMLIVVRERTREIGIRKTIGAKPIQVVSMIMQESIALTTLAGYTGLVIGVGILEGIRYIIANFMEEAPLITNPEIDFNVALAATIILILSGALAGIVPALNAARIRPIEALRT